MGEVGSGRYVKRIVLEIVDRIVLQSSRAKRKEKLIITKFNVREAAYAFLRQYQGANLIQTQKLSIWFNQKELHLRVHDLIYEKMNKPSNTSVQFIHRQSLFSEIEWPPMTIYRTNRVRWASDQSEISPLKTIQPPPNEVATANTDGDYSSIQSNEYASVEPRVPLTSSAHADKGNSDSGLRQSSTDLENLVHKEKDENKHFLTSIYIRVNKNKPEQE